MQNNFGNNPAIQEIGSMAGITIRPLMRSVYMWMTVALLVTAGIAYFLANQLLTNPDLVMQLSGLFLPIIIVQLVIGLGLTFFLNRGMNPTLAGILFMVYAITMGVTLSVVIFGTIAQPTYNRLGQMVLEPDWGIVYKAFLTTAGLFGVMTVIGYTTKVDLDKFSTFFMMGLIGLIIAMVVNIFMKSDALSFIISIAGVLIFVGLTAWDTQKIKKLAESGQLVEGTPEFARYAIHGAFMLYLDFINLFMFLLRLYSRANRR